MRFLRTASTRRLLAGVAGLVAAAIVAGSAIAIASSGAGPVPAHKPLAQAIHSALAAPAPAGITAGIKFTNNLIDSNQFQGADPLIKGAKGRLWLGANHQFRLELQGENGDANLVVHNGSFWVYDPQSNTVYEGTLPAQTGKPQTPAQDKVPTLADIQTNLKAALAHVNLSGATPTDVAGRPTYTVRVSPQHSAGLLGSVKLAWDALRGVPLSFALYSSTQKPPVLALTVTDISYRPVKSKVFKISPPPGAKVVKLATPATGAASRAKDKAHAKDKTRAAKQISGVGPVASQVHFRLVAPKALDGLPRQSVSLLDWGGTPAALVSYGKNLGGIAVIEQKAQAGAAPKPSTSNGDQKGLSLPPVSINGATGQELDTAIGTVLRFTLHGVSYTVLGSVPPAAAVAAAHDL